jgi:hypothetical protein
MVGFLDQSDFPKITKGNCSATFMRLNGEFKMVLDENERYVNELKDDMDSTQGEIEQLQGDIDDLKTIIDENMQKNKRDETMEIDQDQTQPQDQLNFAAGDIDDLVQRQEQKKSAMEELTQSLSKISKEYEDARDFYYNVNGKLHVFMSKLSNFVGEDPAKFFSNEVYTLSYDLSRIINLQQQQTDQNRFGLYFHVRLIDAFCSAFFGKRRFSQIEVSQIETGKRIRKKTTRGGASKMLDSHNLNELRQITPSVKNDIALTSMTPSVKNKFESSLSVQQDQGLNKMNNDLSFDEIIDENGDAFFVAEYGFYMDYGKIDPIDEDSEMQLMIFPIKTEEQLKEVKERFKPLQPSTHIGGKGRRANRDAIKRKKTKKRVSNKNPELKRVTKNKGKNKNGNKSKNNKSENKKNINRKKTRR